MTEHILIIDCDLQELRRLREILAREGYNIMTASDDKTAQEICAQLPVKLVIAEAKLFGFASQPSSKILRQSSPRHKR